SANYSQRRAAAPDIGAFDFCRSRPDDRAVIRIVTSRLMQAFMRALVCALLLGIALPAVAETPDPVLFAVRVEAGDLPAAEQWLAAGLDQDYEGDRIGSGLMIAAWEGNVPMMALFHRYGADVNRINRNGEQALLHAAWKGRKSAVEWLLAHGAQLDRPGRHWSALHYAA